MSRHSGHMAMHESGNRTTPDHGIDKGNKQEGEQEIRDSLTLQLSLLTAYTRKHPL